MLICRPTADACVGHGVGSERLFADMICTVKCHRQPNVSTTHAS